MAIDPRDEIDELVAGAVEWAEQNGSGLDPGWLADLLQIYSFRIDAPDSWQRGSVTELITRFLPAYGRGAAPERQTLQSTLGTYWRFLKATGRLAPGSAQPSRLGTELTQATPKLHERWNDRRFWAQSRVLEDFGESFGIDFSSAHTEEELQGRIDVVNQAWNSLPQEERWRLMPERHPDAAQPPYAGTYGELLDEDEEGDDDYDDFLTDEDIEAMRPDEQQAVRDVEAAAFTKKCLALADWVGDGRAVTAKGVLRPAVAREAVTELGISTRDGREYAWRSAGDYYPLDRLWRACLHGQLIEVRGSKAFRLPPEPGMDAVDYGLARAIPIFLDEIEFGARPLFGLLVTLLQPPRGERVPLDNVRDWYVRRVADTEGREVTARDADLDRAVLDYCLESWDDVGLFTRDEDSIAITDFGRAFTFTLMGLDEAGEIDLEAQGV